MAVMLVVSIIVIIPAVIVINVIWQTRELHTKHFFFVANLLATDIASVLVESAMQYLVMILSLLGLNSNSTGTLIKWLLTPPFTLLLTITILLPAPIAIEHMIVIAFPFHHRSIMMIKTVVSILVAMWGLLAIFAIMITIIVPVDIVWSLGLVDLHVTVGRFISIPQLASALVTLVVNVFLQYKVTISNRKARENQKLGNEEEAKRFRKLVQQFRAQTKATITSLLVGGIDVIANMLIPLLYVVISVSMEPSNKVYAKKFLIYPLRSSLLLSHSLVYGLYLKKIRRRLPNCTPCPRQRKTFHSRVVTLHQQP